MTISLRLNCPLRSSFLDQYTICHTYQEYDTLAALSRCAKVGGTFATLHYTLHNPRSNACASLSSAALTDSFLATHASQPGEPRMVSSASIARQSAATASAAVSIAVSRQSAFALCQVCEGDLGDHVQTSLKGESSLPRNELIESFAASSSEHLPPAVVENSWALVASVRSAADPATDVAEGAARLEPTTSKL